VQLRFDGTVPLYMQLKTILASQIDRGELRPHEKLPSERELCRNFGISRMTVRHALDALAQGGLVYTQPGKGIFVADPRLSLNVQVSLAGWSEDVRRSGATPSSILLEACLCRATSEQAKALHVTEEEELVRIERLRMVDKVPLAMQTAYLPHHLCPDLLQYDLATQSLIRILGKEYGLRLARAEETVRAMLAKPEERELLGLSDPAPVLSTERTTYLDTGEVIEFSHGIFCGEWYRLKFGLDPYKG
jgi:GntR family transcriptional regulator